jgi:hypothetical protein
MKPANSPSCSVLPLPGRPHLPTDWSLWGTARLPARVTCRLIKGGGVYLNNARVSEELAVVDGDALIDGRMLLLAAGKKNKMLVRLSQL